MKSNQQLWRAALIVAALTTAGGVHAHGDEAHAMMKAGPVKKEQKDWGIAGDAKAVSRTINVTMMDSMRFSPDRVEIKLGDTVRFAHKNAGGQLHEFVIGTPEENDAHAALMVKFPGMEHSEPYMAHVGAGKTGEIIWTFNKPGEFDYACLIAGHYQAGMKGKIIVAAASPKTK
jgi:uncharacterized cupredoxin-like copper-binding protein